MKPIGTIRAIKKAEIEVPTLIGLTGRGRDVMRLIVKHRRRRA